MEAIIYFVIRISLPKVCMYIAILVMYLCSISFVGDCLMQVMVHSESGMDV